MKKFLLVLAVAGFAVACNNSGKSDTPAEDTTTVAPVMEDTTVAPAVDTTASVDTTAAAE